MERLKQIELDLLKAFVAICQKHALQYYVIGGTLLGAIRHKGFIPWDDDIDVGMPRKDYEELMRIAQTELPEYYFLQNFRTDPAYLGCFAKLRDSRTTFLETSVNHRRINHGVYIDIFPLDYYPASHPRWFGWKKNLYFTRISAEYNLVSPSPKRRLAQKLLKIIYPSVGRVVARLDRFLQSIPPSSMYANFSGAWGKKEIMPVEWYGEGVEAVFEGLTVTVPEAYDKYLTQVYGDYMTPPPVEQQVTHHYTDVIDLDHPYTDYIQ